LQKNPKPFWGNRDSHQNQKEKKKEAQQYQILIAKIQSRVKLISKSET
jgi:hypothetical protein